jgi:hypothetical protein
LVVFFARGRRMGRGRIDKGCKTPLKNIDRSCPSGEFLAHPGGESPTDGEENRPQKVSLTTNTEKPSSASKPA